MAIFERQSNARILTNYATVTDELYAPPYQVKCRFYKSMQPISMQPSSNQSQPKQSWAQFSDDFDLIRLH